LSILVVVQSKDENSSKTTGVSQRSAQSQYSKSESIIIGNSDDQTMRSEQNSMESSNKRIKELSGYISDSEEKYIPLKSNNNTTTYPNIMPSPQSIVSMSRAGVESPGTQFQFSIGKVVEPEEVLEPATESSVKIKSFLDPLDTTVPASPTTNSDRESSSLIDSSKSRLMIPVVSLFCVVVLIVSLGSLRGLLSIYKKGRRGSKKGSRTSSIDSRRSSGSRVTLYSNSSSIRRQQQREKQKEKERDKIYQELGLKEITISPFIEVIEPTPVLEQKAINTGIYCLASSHGEMQGSSTDISDCSQPMSDISSVSQVCDRWSDMSDLSKSEHGDPKEGSANLPKEIVCYDSTVISNGVLRSHNGLSEQDCCPALIINGRDGLPCNLASVESLYGSHQPPIRLQVPKIHDSRSTNQKGAKVVEIKKESSRGRKLRFNPFDEFSE